LRYRKFGLEGIGKDDQATLSANIVSALQGGCFLGAVIAWALADLIGRKPSLLVAPVVAAIGISLQAASFGHLAVMYVGRYV
jgi:MFS family permease